MRTLFVSTERVLLEKDIDYRFHEGDKILLHPAADDPDDDDFYEIVRVMMYVQGIDSSKEPTVICQIVPFIEEGD